MTHPRAGVDATFISPVRLSLEGDRTGEFRIGQRLFAFCGEDGAKAVEILNMNFTGSITVMLVSGDRLTNQLDKITYQREEELVNELAWEGEGEPPDYFRGILWVDTTIVTTTTTTTTTVPPFTTTSTTTTTTTTVPYELVLNFDEFPFIDESANVFNIVNAGGVTRSAVESRTGGYSALFDGGATGYITVEDNSIWDFGTDDFILSVWAFPTTLVSNADIICRRNSEVVRGFVLNRLTTQWRFYATSNESTWDICTGIVIGTANQDAWNHIVIQRIGSNFYTWLNGIPGAGAVSALAIADTDVLHIGSAAGTGNTRYVGYLDKLTIFRG